MFLGVASVLIFSEGGRFLFCARVVFAVAFAFSIGPAFCSGMSNTTTCSAHLFAEMSAVVGFMIVLLAQFAIKVVWRRIRDPIRKGRSLCYSDVGTLCTQQGAIVVASKFPIIFVFDIALEVDDAKVISVCGVSLPQKIVDYSVP